MGTMRRKVNGSIQTTIGKHKPMITSIEYNQIQQIIHKGRGCYNAKHEYAYKQLFECGICHGSIGAQTKTRMKCSNCGQYIAITKNHICPECKTVIISNQQIFTNTYYGCNQKHTSSCHGNSVNEKVIDNWSVTELNRVDIPDPLLSWALEHQDGLTQVNQYTADEVLKGLKIRLEKLVQRDEKLDERFLDQDENNPIYTPEDYKRLKAKNIKDLDEVKLQIAKFKQEHNIQDVENFDLHTFGTYWLTNGDPKSKRTIVSALGSNFVLLNGQIVANTSNRAFFLTPSAR